MKKQLFIFLCVCCAAICISSGAYAERTDWVRYEDFSDWDLRCTEWSNGANPARAAIVEGADPYIEILPSSSITRIITNAPDDAVSVLNDSEKDYRIVIKARAAAGTLASGRACTPAEIALLSGTTLRQKLLNLAAEPDGTITAIIHDRTSIGNVDAGEWLDIIIVGDIANGEGDWSYYINGNYYGGYSYLPASGGVNAVHLGTRSNASGYFDDIEIYITDDCAADASLEKDSVAPDEEVVIKLTTETLAENISDGSVALDGVPLEKGDFTLLRDYRTLIITPPNGTWEDAETHTVSFTGTKDIYAGVIESKNLDFSVKIPEPPTYSGSVVKWIDYEDFSNWEITSSDWLYGTDTSRAVCEDEHIRIKPGATISVMTGISYDMPNKIKELIDSDEDYKLVIKAKTSVYSHDPATGGIPIEIALAKGMSTKQKLFNVNATKAGVYTAQLHSTEDLGIDISAGDWIDVLIVADISNGSGRWTYYINDELCGSYSYNPSDIDTIRFATRGIASGCFDDIEVYAVKDGEVKFEVTDVTDTVDASKNIIIKFNTGLRKDGIPAEAVLIDGEAVSDELISIGKDGRSIEIIPKNGMWMPNNNYAVTINNSVTNIFGTPLQSTVQRNIKASGWSVFASGLEVKQDGGMIKAGLKAVNVSGNNAAIYMILMLCDGSGNEYMVKASEVKLIELPADGTVVEAEILTEADEADFARLIVVDADSLQPVSYDGLTVDLRR